jgi:hypothetical protein
VEPPSERPELHDVEVPFEREPAPTAAVAAVVEPPSQVDLTSEPGSASGGEESWDSGPATHAIGGLDGGSDPGPFAAEASAARSPVAAPPRPEPAEWPPPAPVAEAPPVQAASPAPAPAAESSWLSTSDSDWSTTSTAWDAPAPWEHDASQAAVPPEPFGSDVPMEANAVDTDSLDDDAFFASLREAVRDDAPLGPRDDEQATFFDSGAEQDRRRFRRRR